MVTVQTGTVARAQDLTSLVTGSGEVRPKTYTNVLGEKIREIVVKEGDQVKKGDVLLRLESIQPAADVEAQQANIDSSEAAVKMADANYRSVEATLVQNQADLERARRPVALSSSLCPGRPTPQDDPRRRRARPRWASSTGT
ncbi:MAG: biotin/lipoyl-binding protein [Candidatus Acidiferrales bacterium]